MSDLYPDGSDRLATATMRKRCICQIVDEWIEIYEQDGKPLPEATATTEERAILDVVHDAAKGLHGAGVMDAQTMREFDATCTESNT